VIARDDRTIVRVRELMLSSVRFHTIEEVKARLEKIHHLRFSKTEIVAALGKLRGAGYALEKRDRTEPGTIGKIPEYRLRDRAAEQLPLIGGGKNAFPN